MKTKTKEVVMKRKSFMRWVGSVTLPISCIIIGIALVHIFNYTQPRHGTWYEMSDSRQESLQITCRHYGHAWSKWNPTAVTKEVSEGYLTPDGKDMRGWGACHPGMILVARLSWNGEVMWKRTCPTCGKYEHKRSWSLVNPDVTKAMYDCAREQAEKKAVEEDPVVIQRGGGGGGGGEAFEIPYIIKEELKRERK